MQQLGESGVGWGGPGAAGAAATAAGVAGAVVVAVFSVFFRVDISSHCHVAASRCCLSYLSASDVTSLLAICEQALSLLLCVLVLLSLLLLVLVSLLLLALLLLLLLLLVVKCFSLLFVSKWWHVAVRVQIRQHVVSFFSERRS